MKNIVSALATMAVMAVPATLTAQVLGDPTAEARARVACGSATLVSATYIGNGMLRVTCSQPNKQSESPSSTEAGITGTGLTVPPALGVVLGVTFIAIIGGTDNVATTTTTTEASSTTTEPIIGER